MTAKLLEPIAEAGAYSFLYLHLQPQASIADVWAITPERVAYALGLAIFIGFYGGKIWKDFLSSKSKSARDYEDIQQIKASLSNIERQLAAHKSDIDKDLISRRALVDKEVTVLTLGVSALERRASMIESRHNRLRDQFNRLSGCLAPVLKDMDVDLTRMDVTARLMSTTDISNDDIDSDTSGSS